MNNIGDVKNTNLERFQLTTDRRPSYRVVIWNPNKTTTQDVVRGVWKGNSFDISPWVVFVNVYQNQVFENNNEAISSRIEMSVLVDSTGFDFGDTVIPINQNLFRDGTPIRVYEGDRRIGRESWVPVFTGTIRGFPGAERAKRGLQTITVVAFGRAQAYQHQEIVGISFSYEDDLGEMAVATALRELKLERDEIKFGNFGYLLKHKSAALTQIGKMQGLFELMYPVGRKPYFDAYGFLVAHDTSFDKPPVYSFDNNPLIVEVSRIQSLESLVNSVQVRGLDYKLTKVVEPTKLLAQIDTTVGYFDTHYRELIYYSDDRTRRAQDTFIDEHHSGSFFSGGGSASWTEQNEFCGLLEIDTEYAPYLLAYVYLAWSLLSLIEAILDARGGGVWLGIIMGLKAGYTLLLLVLMSKIGRWGIDVFGDPYEHVYKELRAIAALDDVNTADRSEALYEMQLISDQDTLVTRAKNLLRREVAKTHTYRIVMSNVAAIQPDDIIEIRDDRYGMTDFSQFYIVATHRQYGRDPVSDVMVLTAWHIKDVSSDV